MLRVNVLVQQLRERSVLARMTIAAVGIGKDEVLHHELLDVLLVHIERRHGRTAVENDLNRRLDGRHTARLRDLIEPPAEDGLVACGRHQERVRAASPAKIFLHFFLDARARRRIVQPDANRVRASRFSPPRQQ